MLPFWSEPAVLTSTSQEVSACKGEWDQVKVTLSKFHDTVLQFRHGRDDSAPLPNNAKAAFRDLEICLMEVLQAVRQYEAVSMGKLTLQHGALKEEATSWIRCIDMAVKDLEVCKLCLCICF